MRSASAAVAYARRYTRYRTQYCLNFVQTMLGAPWSGPSAVWAWNNAKGKHGPDAAPPAGVPVFWTGSKYGHVALSVGGGRCRSTDWPSRGRVGEAPISEISRAWGRKYVGWAEYLGGQKIPGVSTQTQAKAAPKAAPRKPSGGWASKQAYVHMLKHGSKDSDSVRNLQKRLIDLGYSIPAGPTGNWYGQTDRAVAAWKKAARQPAPYDKGTSVGPKQAARLFKGTGIKIVP